LVVAHTHWDREWYLPAGRFRQRLVALVDELLDGAASRHEPFLLDGQAVVLDDYLAVKAAERERLGEFLRDGSLEAGPWYVLADELIPSGEALVRNLLAGRAALDSLGARSPQVLYCPDSFGHPAALPLLAAGFGFPLIILWRGYGGRSWPAGDVFRWRGPDGSAALVYHLSRSGYELGSSLPVDARAAEARWQEIREALLPRATAGVALLPNGADHHAPQPHLDEAIAALARAAQPVADVERGSLGEFADAVEVAARAVELPKVENDRAGGSELRDSYGYTWALQGTFAARARLKRRNAHVERLLVRDTEPWIALTALRDGRADRRALLRAAWKTLLLCHPHDTLCGCSVDEVARAMDARLDDAASQATGLRDDALFDVVGHDPAAARRDIASWCPVVVVRNDAPRTRGGVAELEVLRLREHVNVGPGSALAPGAGDTHDVAPVPADLPSFTLAGGRAPFQLLERAIRHDRIESPVAYPYDDLVESDRVVAWVPPVAGYGTSSLPIDPAPAAELPAEPLPGGRAAGTPPPQVASGECWLDNGVLRVSIGDGGAVRMESRELSVVWDSLVGFEDVGDVGDLYTHSPRTPTITDARFLGAKLVYTGPLRGEVHAAWVLDTPESSARAERSSRTRETKLYVALTLDAGAPYLRVRAWGSNDCRDHRLRIVFRSAIENAEVWADAAFGPVRRDPVAAADTSAETPPPTAPLHRYVTLAGPKNGLTLFSDGLAEYEATPTGDIAVTLVRAVGELSRNDLPERPGHAGWPAPTPEAQSLGAFEAGFALLPHGERSDETIALVERTADDVLLPLRGTTLRSALAIPGATAGVELLLDHESEALHGALAFSTCKPTEDGDGVTLRCVNITDRPLRARWRLGVPVSQAWTARLDETRLEQLPTDGQDIPFGAGPRSVTTIIVRGTLP
ncbi:MAG TPA: hypothetical protein VFK39_10530, partial [Gemmatimonadaceae bacterium]|nr:hypothetical protein [Gemmatimonadaceae bacterium]